MPSSNSQNPLIKWTVGEGEKNTYVHCGAEKTSVATPFSTGALKKKFGLQNLLFLSVNGKCLSIHAFVLRC